MIEFGVKPNQLNKCLDNSLFIQSSLPWIFCNCTPRDRPLSCMMMKTICCTCCIMYVLTGVSVGHRSLQRYYRQNLPPRRSPQGQSVMPRLLAQYKALGWTGIKGKPVWLSNCRSFLLSRTFRSAGHFPSPRCSEWLISGNLDHRLVWYAVLKVPSHKDRVFMIHLVLRQLWIDVKLKSAMIKTLTYC